jgi:hypothetical protein
MSFSSCNPTANVTNIFVSRWRLKLSWPFGTPAGNLFVLVVMCGMALTVMRRSADSNVNTRRHLLHREV